MTEIAGMALVEAVSFKMLTSLRRRYTRDPKDAAIGGRHDA